MLLGKVKKGDSIVMNVVKKNTFILIDRGIKLTQQEKEFEYYIILWKLNLII